MALIKCKECGEEISSKAESCPKCGFKQDHQPKKFSAWWLFFVLIIIGYFALNTSTNTEKQTKVDNRTLEQMQADKERREAMSMVAKAQNRLKNTLKNPDSFEMVDYGWKRNKDSWTIKMTYRATNSFNAVVTEQVILDIDDYGNLLKITPIE